MATLKLCSQSLGRQITEKGKCAMANNIRGTALNKFFEGELGRMLSSNPRFEVVPNYRVKTPGGGLRILDLVVVDKYKTDDEGEPEPVHGFEIKAGNSPYRRPEEGNKKPNKQGAQDSWIENERENTKIKELKGKSFPITCVRAEKLTKEYCGIQ